MHYRWKTAGASFSLDEHGWQMPDHFIRLEDEVLAAKQSVVVGDISNVGKFSLKGTGALRLYEKEFGVSQTVNVGDVLDKSRDSTLREKCVYCILAQDEVLILSRGRSAKEVHHYVLQTTKHDSHNEGCSHVIDLTSFFAGLYLIGPNNRKVISKLSELNVNPESMPNFSVAQSSLFHVQCIVMRFDLNGLVAFQLFFDRGYGEFLLDRLLDSGNEFGIRPCGLAALRSLGWRWA